MPRPQKLRPPKTHDRPWGTGTVKEVSAGVWRAWRARVHTPDGTITRPSQTFRGESAEQDAKEWAGGDPEPAVLYLGHHLEHWLRLRKPTLDPSTYDLYRRAVDACDSLKARPLAALTVDEWQALTNELLGRWSRYHVYVWKGNISTALRTAIPEHLTTNPLERVKLPQADEQPPKVWRQDEVDRLLAAADGHRHEPWLLFSLGTGVRLGEARALRWEDVDLTRATATIRASLDNATGARGPTKTRRVRMIDLPDEVVAILAAHSKRQPAGQVLVFGHDGRAYGCSTLRAQLKKLCAAAKVALLSPHAFRHTFASLALDDGVPIQDIARQLGHTVETCQRTYAHFIGQDLRRAAKALGKALRHRFSGPKRISRAKNDTQQGG